LAGGAVGGFERVGPLGVRGRGSTCAGIPFTVELGDDGGGTVGGLPGGRPPSDALMRAS